MKISFCTTSRDRRVHLEETLRRNLALAGDPGKYEFVVLDYNSGDGLEACLRATYRDALATGLLALYRTSEPEVFHHSHAKNCAHRLASGDVVVNLDSDSLLVERYLEHLETLEPSEVLTSRGELDLTGRIAMFKRDFEAIGGYDEDMKYGWGWEDDDLIIRCRTHGFHVRTLPASHVGSRISHSDEHRVRHCRVQDKHTSWEYHRRISLVKAQFGVVVANRGRPWGACRVTRAGPSWPGPDPGTPGRMERSAAGDAAGAGY
jgi:glycosyltransferase involved in cell wall biosynthesis